MNPLEDAWPRIGLLLALLQHTEHTINVALSWVFSDTSVTLEQIASFESVRQKKTLGALLKALHDRVNIDTDFDSFLTMFLYDRNRFVHRLFTEEGFGIHEPKDASRIREFVDSLTHRTGIVLAAFHAFIEIWAEEHDLSGAEDAFNRAPALRKMIDHFKQHIRPKGLTNR